jgi:hypothetical protein
MMLSITSLSTILLTLAASITALPSPALSAVGPRAEAAASPSKFTPPSGKAKFELLAVPIASTGNISLGGTWFQAAHSAAGQTTALLSNNQSFATVWKFNAKLGNIYFNEQVIVNNKTEEVPNTVILGTGALQTFPGQAPPPAGLMPIFTEIANVNPQNFTFNPVTNLVTPPSGVFSACYLRNAAPYGGPGSQLVWHTTATQASANCIDVALEAINSF